ncbi:MAG TPA: hypothetical protein VFN53_12650 [Acidobacteriaceae bacterium]|nr:hypothetical protein [Acidobacteriaceae bacterium]
MKIAPRKSAFPRDVLAVVLLACSGLLWPSLALSLPQPTPAPSPAQSAPANEKTFQRVTEQLRGVFSPRSFFNILVRIETLPGVVRAKFDLKKSQLTLDFLPGAAVYPDEIRKVMVDAGYTPGPFKIENIPVSAPPDNRPGWVNIKHPRSRSALVRWLEINF